MSPATAGQPALGALGLASPVARFLHTAPAGLILCAGVEVVRSRTFAVQTCFLVVASLIPVAPSAAYEIEPLCSYPEDSRWDLAFTPNPAPAPEVPMCAPRSGPRFEEGLDDRDARRALARARNLASQGRQGEAVLALRIVSTKFPRLADYVALEEGEYRMADGADPLACAAFERASESPHRDLAVRAKVRHTACLLGLGDRRGDRELEALIQAYPELPQREELELLQAQAFELRGEPQAAAARYRAIDLMSPGAPRAERARAALERLRREGVEIRELTLAQQADRTERLTRGGYHEMARPELARLRAMDLPRPIAQQLARSAARIARVEGRFTDAEQLLREAVGLPTDNPQASRALEARASNLARAARETEALEAELRRLRRGPISRQPTGRVLAVLKMAARGGLQEHVDDMLRELARRNRVPPNAIFDAAIIAAGTGDDALVEPLFASLLSQSRYRVPALYHHARTLERLGRISEARRQYAEVIAEDSTQLPYYALWARQRLRETRTVQTGPGSTLAAWIPGRLACSVGPYTPQPVELTGKMGRSHPLDDATCTMPNAASPATTSEAMEAITAALDPGLAVDPPRVAPARPPVELTAAEIEAQLAPLADAHGEAFPWLLRALDLVRLGELRAATDELHATYIAYREAGRSGTLRAGFVAVLRGAAPARDTVSRTIWRARRGLPSEARAVLARLSAALGDPGLAIRWNGNFDVTGLRPRAYEDIVVDAAARHGVEPELLLAVMRVESIYNPRIISYAGAIGLMQIMPRTGRLIANRLERDDFTVDRLLEPEVNIEFAAWYLASLIERWDGRIPLALASYNGGPHNVRRWLHDHATSMPLDAFLERIPFSQTHRYVRRVLTHYEAYRAQDDRQFVQLDVALPTARPDSTAF